MAWTHTRAHVPDLTEAAIKTMLAWTHTRAHVPDLTPT
jgi:hypothetical protein